MHKLFEIAGSSGSGKTTLSRQVFLPQQKLITTTSRAPRKGEAEGVDYYFRKRNEFLNKIHDNEFVEYNEFVNVYYGLTKEEYYPKIKENHVYIILDFNGIKTYKELFPDSISIFIDIDKDEAYQNMVERGDTKENIEKRMEKYERESSSKNSCDFVVLNKRGYFDEAVNELRGIINDCTILK